MTRSLPCLALAALALPAFADMADQRPGAVTAAALSSAITACSSGEVTPLDADARAALLERGGWREVTAADRGWYIGTYAQMRAVWEVIDTRNIGNAAAIWRKYAAGGTIRDLFEAELPQRINYRTDEGALLAVGASTPLCLVLSSEGEAGALIYESLPSKPGLDASLGLETSRNTGSSPGQAGLYGIQKYDTAALSQLFATDFRLTYVFTIVAPKNTATIRN
ncbi:hypothetical protein [Pseudogemmobacter bohemicus]|uniref:hypothetical protein n=1 Tax=Pseudogemmobacter bohemicus TaxID=2250708 RepID=UPI000DD438DF|nr:hypothetical protein [Pseudogemmobacter bohemicus]